MAWGSIREFPSVTWKPFGLQAAGRLMTEIFAPWVQELALLVESVEAVRPPGALPEWQPGAVVRLPFAKKLCRDGAVVCSQALMALADTAMVFACSAAWNGYRPMSTIDQTTHFLRPVNFDVLADARVVRIGRNTSFGRVMLLGAPTGGRLAWCRAPMRCCDDAAAIGSGPGTPGRLVAGKSHTRSSPASTARFQLARSRSKAACAEGWGRPVATALSSPLILAPSQATCSCASAGPGPGITGNDTGGIIPYSPDRSASIAHIAADHCARWGRLCAHYQRASPLWRLHRLCPASTHPSACPLTQSPPVAERSLHQRERRDRGGIGAQDARAEREPHDVRPPQQRRALVLGKAAFRPDQDRKRRPAAAPRASAATGSPTSASSSQNTRRRAGIERGEQRDRARPARAISGSVRMPHCSAASMALARMRSRLTRATWPWRVSTGCSRETPISTAFCTM